MGNARSPSPQRGRAGRRKNPTVARAPDLAGRICRAGAAVSIVARNGSIAAKPGRLDRERLVRDSGEILVSEPLWRYAFPECQD